MLVNMLRWCIMSVMVLDELIVSISVYLFVLNMMSCER